MSRSALAAAALFLIAGALFIGLTGAGHDEAAHAVVAARWVLPGLRSNETSWLPWMQSSYMGALKSWFFAPAFALLGVSLTTMRLVTLAFGAAAAAGLALLAGTLYGPELGLLAGLLAATDPALVLGASHDTGPAAFAVAVKLWGLWLCARRRAGSGRWTLALAGVLFGLGVWDKSHFLWFLAALAVLAPAAGATAGDAATLVAGTALGAAPWLWFNLSHPLATFRDPGHQGWTISQHLPALAHWTAFRLKTWMETADGADALAAVAAVPRRFLEGPTILPAALQASSAAVLAAALAARGRLERLRPAAWWLALLALIAGAAIASPLPVKGHHLYMAYPFGLLALASLLAAAREEGVLGARALRSAVLVLLAAQAAALAGARADLARTGGSPFFYRGVGDMAAWLKANAGGAPVYAMPRLAGPLLIESGGAMDARPVEDGDPAREPGRFAFLNRPGTLLVWRAAPFVYADEDADLPEKAAKALGARLETAAEFPYSDGRTWAVVERVADASGGDPATVAEHLERGNALYFAGDLAGAEREFSAAARGDASDPSP